MESATLSQQLDSRTEANILFQKDIGWSFRLTVVHAQTNLRVEMAPIHTGTHYDYETAVSLSPAIWAEFSRKFSDFNFHYKDSGFTCGNELVVLSKVKNTCIIQQLIPSYPGFRLANNCIELDEEEVILLRDIQNQVSELLLENLFTSALPFCIQNQRNLCKASTNFLTNEEVEKEVLQCLYHSLSECVSTHYKCEGCKTSQMSQLEHSCFIMSIKEKFEYLGKDILLYVNLKELARNICQNIPILNVNLELVNIITVDKCLSLLKNEM